MAKKYVYRIKADGTIEGLWTDLLASLPSESVEVVRASNVEFSPEAKGWTVDLVTPPRGLIEGSFQKRADALDVERNILNEAIRQGAI